MQIFFENEGERYVAYQEHGATILVDGEECGEWTVRKMVPGGRAFYGRFHVPSFFTCEDGVQGCLTACIDQREAA